MSRPTDYLVFTPTSPLASAGAVSRAHGWLPSAEKPGYVPAMLAAWCPNVEPAGRDAAYWLTCELSFGVVTPKRPRGRDGTECHHRPGNPMARHATERGPLHRRGLTGDTHVTSAVDQGPRRGRSRHQVVT